MGKNITNITSDTMNILKNHPWHGNIRELENAIERAVVLASERELTPDLLPALIEGKSAEEIEIGTSLEEALLKFKRQFITKTLAFTNSNQTKAAELLKIQRTYLNRLIKEFDI